MNVNIWIRDPYPFRIDERNAIEQALRQTYTHKVVYLREWPVDFVSVDNTNITTCKQIASTLKVIHWQWAIQDKSNTGRIYCTELEIDIRGVGDGRPSWAMEERGK